MGKLEKLAWLTVIAMVLVLGMLLGRSSVFFDIVMNETGWDYNYTCVDSSIDYTENLRRAGFDAVVVVGRVNYSCVSYPEKDSQLYNDSCSGGFCTHTWVMARHGNVLYHIETTTGRVIQPHEFKSCYVIIGIDEEFTEREVPWETLNVTDYGNISGT